MVGMIRGTMATAGTDRDGITLGTTDLAGMIRGILAGMIHSGVRATIQDITLVIIRAIIPVTTLADTRVSTLLCHHTTHQEEISIMANVKIAAQPYKATEMVEAMPEEMVM